MAPILASLASRPLDTARILLAARSAIVVTNSATHNAILRRGLGVDHTQAVTLGIIAVYVVVIALLWNLPYVRWSLWPFKVRNQFSLVDGREEC